MTNAKEKLKDLISFGMSIPAAVTLNLDFITEERLFPLTVDVELKSEEHVYLLMALTESKNVEAYEDWKKDHVIIYIPGQGLNFIYRF